MPGGVFVGGGGRGSVEKKTGNLVQTWYDAFNTENYDLLLSLFPDDLYQKVSREQMRGIFASYRAKLGSLKSRKLNFERENHPGGQSTFMLQYVATYEKGDSHDTFTIVSKSPADPLKIAKVEYDNPMLKR